MVMVKVNIRVTVRIHVADNLISTDHAVPCPKM